MQLLSYEFSRFHKTYEERLRETRLSDFRRRLNCKQQQIVLTRFDHSDEIEDSCRTMSEEIA